MIGATNQTVEFAVHTPETEDGSKATTKTEREREREVLLLVLVERTDTECEASSIIA
jgi:hypothetical protein